MAHTNETSNYELTQFVGSDKPAWLVDYNGDMLAIDTAMKDISDVADAAKSKSDTNETNIVTVTNTANSASAKASGAISDLSDEYDPTSTYAVDDLVIYNNLLYKCTTAITVPESFDGTHWTRTTIEELIDTINSNLSYTQILESGHDTITIPVTINVSKNEVYTTDSYGNFILPHSIQENLILGVRVKGGNYISLLGYNPSLGYYCQVLNVVRDPVTNTQVTVDVIYMPHIFG